MTRSSWVLLWVIGLGCSDKKVAAIADAGVETKKLPPKGLVGEFCSAATPCDKDLFCVDDFCIVSKGDCKSDADCPRATDCHEEHCRDKSEAPIGPFQAELQCEWSGPGPEDPFPRHKNVLATPRVAQLPHDSGAASEIVIVTYNHADGGDGAGKGIGRDFYGVIRVLNGKTCQVIENIDFPGQRVVAASAPAVADINGDGRPEVVAYRIKADGGGLVAFAWSAEHGKYEHLWTGANTYDRNLTHWDGPATYDLNGDGLPEVIADGEVFNGQTGERLNLGQRIDRVPKGYIPVLGDVDKDGNIELISRSVYRWNSGSNRWQREYPGAGDGDHFALADFGKPGATAGSFDRTTFDGVPEIVAVGRKQVTVTTLSGQVLMSYPQRAPGAPPTVGDYDADGRPEIAVGTETSLQVFDLDCASSATPGCGGINLRWRRPSQDFSTSSSATPIYSQRGEAGLVYGDECFTRVLSGKTGKIMYSASRTSCTWYERPVVADVDGDSKLEVVLNANDNCGLKCPEVDPIHPGVACESAHDCASGNCSAGYCRCTADSQCGTGYVCRASLAGTPGAGNTCRAHHAAGVGMYGIRVLSDRLDRWSASPPASK